MNVITAIALLANYAEQFGNQLSGEDATKVLKQVEEAKAALTNELGVARLLAALESDFLA